MMQTLTHPNISSLPVPSLPPPPSPHVPHHTWTPFVRCKCLPVPPTPVGPARRPVNRPTHRPAHRLAHRLANRVVHRPAGYRAESCLDDSTSSLAPHRTAARQTVSSPPGKPSHRRPANGLAAARQTVPPLPGKPSHRCPANRPTAARQTVSPPPGKPSHRRQANGLTTRQTVSPLGKRSHLPANGLTARQTAPLHHSATPGARQDW